MTQKIMDIIDVLMWVTAVIWGIGMLTMGITVVSGIYVSEQFIFIIVRSFVCGLCILGVEFLLYVILCFINFRI